MKKQLLIFVLILLPIVACANVVKINGIWYDLVSTTKQAYVTRNPNKEIKYTGSVKIPALVTYEDIDYIVTSIGAQAFWNCTGLTSVTIPNSVRRIGSDAFFLCTGLTSVAIPNQVTSIEGHAFFGCSGLTSIAFPNSVTSIGRSAFMGCSSLTSVTIPKNVTSIGDFAFCGCSGLVSIVVEDGNSKYDSRNNCNAIIETESNELLCGCMNTIIPNSVTNIGEYAFGSCTGLTSITIPNSVTSIGNEAFEDCTGLTSITIPNSVTSIGWRAFCVCSSLASIVVEDGNSKYDSRNNCNAIIETESNELLCGCMNTIIPNSVTSIGNSAFGCISLTSVTIPNSVTSIGFMAFCGCSGLTSVTIPNSVTCIESCAFSDCTGLTSVISLFEEPFEIDESVFNYLDSESQTYQFSTATLYVPKGTIEKYEATAAWNQFHSIEEIESTAIDDAIANNGESNEAKRYDLSGRRVSESQRGLNIVRQADGTVRKVIVK